MAFRVARTKNYKLVEGLNEEIFGQGQERDWKKDLCWVVRGSRNEPVAFCAASLCDGDSLFLSRAGVLPAFRGKGLQRRMIRVRLAAGKKLGCKYALTYTIKANPESYTSLQKEGFRLYLPDNQWAGPEMLYWIRDL